MIVTDGNRGSLEGPCLVEIAGVAGAGKSTLARRLSRGEGDVRVGDFIHTRTPAHLRYVVHSLPRIAPILAGTLGPGPRLSWPEAKLLVYVTEWHRFLCSRAEYEGGVTLLDQGPLYALVRLKAQGKNVTGRAAFERWWNEMLEQWASHLDLVVWLDAPDAVLWERINGRDQRHDQARLARGRFPLPRPLPDVVRRRPAARRRSGWAVGAPYRYGWHVCGRYRHGDRAAVEGHGVHGGRGGVPRGG